MKKIAIVTRKMVAGGIEKSILSMINSIPKDKYEITLFVMATGGEFEKYVPEHVKVKPIYGNEKTTLEKVTNNIKRGKLIKAIKIVIYTILSQKSKYVFDREKYYLNIVQEQHEEYDLAIADHVPASLPVIYVVEKLKAKKRVAWIHSDVSRYKDQLDRYESYYEKYDKIFSVSIEAKDKLIDMYPKLSNKVDVFYNIISKEELQELAKQGEGYKDNFNDTCILTIGRLCDEKGQKIIPDIAKRLIEDGYKFKWYCVGEGEDRILLENRIKELELDKNIKLLGNKNNPYKYLKECDIYVQPSRYECYCTTVTEAKCLEKPMVITNVNGSKEQIENNKNGLIVEFGIEEIYEGIKILLDNENIRYEFEKVLKNSEVDTRNEINKLEKLFEN